MDQRHIDLVVAAQVHSTIICGEPLTYEGEDLPYDEEELKAWCKNRTNEQALEIVRTYLVETMA